MMQPGLDQRRTSEKLVRASAYRPGQLLLIEAVMNGRHAVGVLPTGAGKSLCFHDAPLNPTNDDIGWW